MDELSEFFGRRDEKPSDAQQAADRIHAGKRAHLRTDASGWTEVSVANGHGRQIDHFYVLAPICEIMKLLGKGLKIIISGWKP